MSLTVLTWYNERLANCLQVDEVFLSNLVEYNLVSSEVVNTLKEKYYYNAKTALFTQKLLIEIDRKKNATQNLHIFLKENECDSAAEILFREPDEADISSKEHKYSYIDESQECNVDKSLPNEDSNLLNKSQSEINRNCL